jgi:hypothetical protein
MSELPAAAEVIKVWDEKLYRADVPQTFQGYCLATYGKTGVAQARQILVTELGKRGCTTRDIAQQIGVSYKTISNDRRALANGAAKAAGKKKKEEDPRVAARKERRRERNRILDQHAEHLYAAMRNAPAGAVTIPMLNRASKIVEALRELAVLDPKVAATQMPAPRCREYSDSAPLADWWATFAAACDERRRTETPELPHLRWSPEWTPEGKLERQRGLTARAVLDLLAAHPGATEAELGVGIATAGIGKILRNLVDEGAITYDADNTTYTLTRGTTP